MVRAHPAPTNASQTPLKKHNLTALEFEGCTARTEIHGIMSVHYISSSLCCVVWLLCLVGFLVGHGVDMCAHDHEHALIIVAVCIVTFQDSRIA